MQCNLPLNLIDGWTENPRLTTDPSHIKELRASAKAMRKPECPSGLLQNLTVVPNKDIPGRFIAITGRSRLTAIQLDAADGEIAADIEVPVQIRDIDINDPEALMLALAENIVRRSMDAIDECIAMAELARKGQKAEAIAVAFGYKTRTVKERLALGRLVPEAQDLIRTQSRDLDWARALTLADASTQVKICSDVTANPAAWKDGGEIRRFLTSDTIPSEHALFDKTAYTGRIIHDMFDGDRLTDRAEFWDLQNKAIGDLKVELEAEGWASVEISHNPVDLWRYRRSDDVAGSKCIIEVSPNGKVTTHKNLVDPEAIKVEEIEEAGGLDVEIGHHGSAEIELHGDGVRLTQSIAEYAAAHRSAMVQAVLANDFRKSLEVAVAGLIGHGEIAIRAQDYRFPGMVDIRTGEAFGAMDKVRGEVGETLDKGGIGGTKRADGAVLAMVASLDDASLQRLFSQLVAIKVGQAQTKRLDTVESSLTNSLGQGFGIDVRAWWTPDEKFFSLMSTEDLRRLAHELLPRERQTGILSGKKTQLVRMLSDGFSDARANDGSIDPENARRLNAWVPGPMSFPGSDDAERAQELISHADGDAFSALFGAEDPAAALFGEALPEEGQDPDAALFAA